MMDLEEEDPWTEADSSYRGGPESRLRSNHLMGTGCIPGLTQ